MREAHVALRGGAVADDREEHGTCPRHEDLRVRVDGLHAPAGAGTFGFFPVFPLSLFLLSMRAQGQFHFLITDIYVMYRTYKFALSTSLILYSHDDNITSDALTRG